MNSFRDFLLLFFLRSKQIWDHSASFSSSRAWLSCSSFLREVRAKNPINHARHFFLFLGGLFILSLRNHLSSMAYGFIKEFDFSRVLLELLVGVILKGKHLI